MGNFLDKSTKSAVKKTARAIARVSKKNGTTEWQNHTMVDEVN